MFSNRPSRVIFKYVNRLIDLNSVPPQPSLLINAIGRMPKFSQCMNIVHNQSNLFPYSSLFSTWCTKQNLLGSSSVGTLSNAILENNITAAVTTCQTRSIIKWSKRRGRRKTDKDVIRRFKRLDWGMWIRPIAGAHRQLWRKKGRRIRRIRQNVFCNSQQSHKLDKMVTNFWKKPRVYPDDPYKPYLKRENFWLSRSQPHDDF